MRFTVNRDEFFSLLSLANEVITPKNPLAVLVNVYLFVSDDGMVIMQGYNGEHGIKIEMTGQVEEGGTILLHAKKLHDVVAHISTRSISLSTESNNLYEVQITSPEDKKIYYKVHGSHAENFPSFQEYTWENYVSLSQESLREIIDMTEYAIAQEATKIYFMGYYIEESMEGWLTFVTTDGRRLVLLRREHEGKTGDFQAKVIIPGSLMRIVKKSLSTGEVRISIRGQNVFFKIGNVYFFSGLLEGKFPNYNDVIPAVINHTAEIPTQDFRSRLDVVAVMSEGEEQRIAFELSENEITLSTAHPIYGEAKASLEVEYSGETLSFFLNYRHLTDFLRVVKSDKVVLNIKSSESPMQLNLKNDADFTYLIMPIRNL